MSRKMLMNLLDDDQCWLTKIMKKKSFSFENGLYLAAHTVL